MKILRLGDWRRDFVCFFLLRRFWPLGICDQSFRKSPSNSWHSNGVSSACVFWGVWQTHRGWLKWCQAWVRQNRRHVNTSDVQKAHGNDMTCWNDANHIYSYNSIRLINLHSSSQSPGVPGQDSTQIQQLKESLQAAQDKCAGPRFHWDWILP